ncbi:protein BatD, partial [Salinimicrobium sp. CDJ15-91]|nr:protein BatD [Salinimicrobium oceani]
MKQKLVLFIMLMMSGLAIGQVQFTANVSKNKLGVNARLRVDF